MHFLRDNSVFYSTITCYFCSFYCYPYRPVGGLSRGCGTAGIVGWMSKKQETMLSVINIIRFVGTFLA